MNASAGSPRRASPLACLCAGVGFGHVLSAPSAFARCSSVTSTSAAEVLRTYQDCASCAPKAIPTRRSPLSRSVHGIELKRCAGRANHSVPPPKAGVGGSVIRRVLREAGPTPHEFAVIKHLCPFFCLSSRGANCHLSRSAGFTTCVGWVFHERILSKGCCGNFAHGWISLVDLSDSFAGPCRSLPSRPATAARDRPWWKLHRGRDLCGDQSATEAPL